MTLKNGCLFVCFCLVFGLLSTSLHAMNLQDIQGHGFLSAYLFLEKGPGL